MNNTTDLRKCFIQLQMSRRIRGRIVSALDFIALQIHDHHIFRFQILIWNAAWFDSKTSGLPVDFTDISPGKRNQPVLWKLHIRFIYSFFQFFQHLFSSSGF